MKLKYQFVLREVSGQWVAVAVGKDHGKFNGMVKLNKTGAFLMECLMKGLDSRQELLKAMLEKYDVTQQRAEENLEAFLDTLQEGALLTD